MLVDITGIELIPGNKGLDCPGNGEHYNCDGEVIECCCYECDYMMCCLETHSEEECSNCNNLDCPRKEFL